MEESSEFLPAVDRAPVLVDEEIEKRNLDALKTRLLPPPSGNHLTYNRVPWKLMVRKEVRNIFSKHYVIHWIYYITLRCCQQN